MPENTEDCALFRDKLRQQLRTARAALSPARHAHHSGAIVATLRDWLAGPQAPVLTARSVGFCLPWQGECAIEPLLVALAGEGWQVSVPVALTPNQPMIFRRWWPQVPLTRDRHGIAIPDTEPCAAPALLLIPLLGVDAHGYRLGYGGGYFDRTLAELAVHGQRPVCVGVGFELARIDTLAAQAHDQPLDALVTEAGLVFFADNIRQTQHTQPRP